MDEQDLQTARELATLTAKQEAMNEMLRDHVTESRADRDNLSKRMNTVEHDTHDLVQRMDKAEPVLTQLEKWRQRGIGAFMFVAAVSSAIGALLMAGWKMVSEWWAGG